LPALKRFLRQENYWPTPDSFPIWTTITIGNTSLDKLSQKLKDNGMKVSDWAADIMKQDAFTVAEQEERIDLVNVSVAELGFDKATCYDAICARAKERGLELCPPEVGPQLRLQYLDQPLSEWIVVAMEAIRGSVNGLSVFSVGHDDGGLWLCGGYGGADDFWYPGHRFVFRARKQPLES
jgi:hypothetical protein